MQNGFAADHKQRGVMMTAAKTGVVCTLLLLFSLTPAASQEDKKYDAIVGDWGMETDFQGQLIPATMKLSVKDGKLTGVWISMNQEMKLTDLEFDGKKLTFARTMGRGGQTIHFEGTVRGDEITGKYRSPMAELKCTGKRKKN
jgi:hypothetical protein